VNDFTFLLTTPKNLGTIIKLFQKKDSKNLFDYYPYFSRATPTKKNIKKLKELIFF